MTAFIRFFQLLWLLVKALFISWRGASIEMQQKICKDMLKCLNVHVNPFPPLPAGYFVFSNHQGWLDGIVLGSVLPCRFVAKSEVKDIPIFGKVAENFRTLFVKRTIPLDKQPELKKSVLEDSSVVCFPEGTCHERPGNLKLGFIKFIEAEKIPAAVFFVSYHPQSPILWVDDEPLWKSLFRVLNHEQPIYVNVSWNRLDMTNLDGQIDSYFLYHHVKMYVGQTQSVQ